MKILFLEDEDMYRRVVAATIRQRGHEVTEVDQICNAYVELSHGKFDRFICDGRLPDGDGYAFAKLWQDKGQDVVQLTSDPRQVLPGVRSVHKREKNLQQTVDAILS